MILDTSSILQIVQMVVASNNDLGFKDEIQLRNYNDNINNNGTHHVIIATYAITVSKFTHLHSQINSTILPVKFPFLFSL